MNEKIIEFDKVVAGYSPSLTMFERIPLDQLLAQAVTDDIDHMSVKQLILFE